MRIAFDLDDTLCSGRPYETARPYEGVKELLDELRAQGHTLILFTARGMGSSAGNPGGAVSKIGLTTLTQLNEWGLEFDEIYFGKPSYDIFVEDKSVSSIDDLLERLKCQTTLSAQKQPTKD